MIETNIVVTIVALLVSLFAINEITSKNNEVVEHMWDIPSFQVKVDRVAQNPCSSKADFYSVPGTYKSILTPRFSNVNYGAYIRYNLPSQDNLAVPCSPLTFNKQSAPMKSGRGPVVSPVSEGYCGQLSTVGSSCQGGSTISCKKGGFPSYYHGGAPLQQAGYANGNFNQVQNSIYKGGPTLVSQVQVPPSDLPAALPGETAPIVYDRFMYANRNSRLRQNSDYFRGDLAIVPSNIDYFKPSVQPNVDLNAGAMNVMGGITNETANQLDKLIYASSGNTQTPLGGVNMAGLFNNANLPSLYSGSLSANQGDVSISTFP